MADLNRKVTMTFLTRKRAHLVRAWASKVGLDLHQWGQSVEVRRSKLLGVAGVRVMLDIGANTGQYVQDLRWGGYTGRVVSFEPLPDAFKYLARAAAGDSQWTAERLAVGSFCGDAELFVTPDSIYSTTRVPTDLMTDASPTARPHRAMPVPAATLDSWVATSNMIGPFGLKLDVQGAEEDVLVGASKTLELCTFLEVELPLRPVYRDQWNLVTALSRIQSLGFVPALTENLMPGPDGGSSLQVNVLFARAASLFRDR